MPKCAFRNLGCALPTVKKYTFAQSPVVPRGPRLFGIGNFGAPDTFFQSLKALVLPKMYPCKKTTFFLVYAFGGKWFLSRCSAATFLSRCSAATWYSGGVISHSKYNIKQVSQIRPNAPQVALGFRGGCRLFRNRGDAALTIYLIYIYLFYHRGL